MVCRRLGLPADPGYNAPSCAVTYCHRRVVDVGGRGGSGDPSWKHQTYLEHTKMGGTVRYLGVELEDALAIAEAIEI